jgi:hypothetical protein
VIENFFSGIEHSALSEFVRGGSFAFPLILTAHVLGAGFIAGTCAVVALRLLGVARGVPVSLFQYFYPVLWSALALNVVSGLLLLDAYPYKAFTNPVYYAKLSFIGLGIYVAIRIRDDVLRAPVWRPGLRTAVLANPKTLAVVSLTCWAAVLIWGRLLAYTYKWLLVGVPGGF